MFGTTAAVAVVLVSLTVWVAAQQTVVDKTVATISDGGRTELITYSDLRWQLALQPNVSLSPPSSEDLNRALRLLIDQRLFALEAERLPTAKLRQKRRSPLRSTRSCRIFRHRWNLSVG